MAPISKLRSLASLPVEKIIPKNFLFWTALPGLTVGLACLSYFDWALSAKLEILLFGLALPLLLLAWSFQPPKAHRPQRPSPAREFFSLPPVWAWVLLALLAAGLRLVDLTSLSQWPLKDEAIFGYFALRLSEQWNWSLTQGLNQLPTLFTWLQAGLFKLLGPSLFSLWLDPALWSLFTLPVVWFASRNYFSRSLSFIILGVAAFSYWPLYLGRISTQAVLMVFWEWLEGWALGRYLRSSPKNHNLNLLVLALVTGLGFYTYLSWPAVALMAALLLLMGRRTRVGRKSLGPLVLWAALSGLIALPLILAYTSPHLGYLHHLWSFSANHGGMEHLQLFLLYFKDIFWGTRPSVFHYGPLWGGFLNPLLGSFFCLGLLVLVKKGVSFLGVALSVPVLFLPAILSNDFEQMRMVQLVPFLTVIIGLGIHQLHLLLPKVKRLPALLCLGTLSLALDAHHLFVVYPSYWPSRAVFYNNHKTVEFQKAYELLNSLADQEGPGLILLNFNPDPYDQSLFVATYSYNAAENPRLFSTSPRWAAILVNAHEQPYLKKLLPRGSWVWLSEGLNRQDGGYLLETVPLDKGNSGVWKHWVLADRSLADLTVQVMEQGVTPEQGPMIQTLEKAYPLFKDDRLLESRYWRIMALHHLAQGDDPAAIADEQKAIEKGLPMAHLYNEMGRILFKEKRVKDAFFAFQKAVHLKPDLTDASNNLQLMARGSTRQ